MGAEPKAGEESFSCLFAARPPGKDAVAPTAAPTATETPTEVPTDAPTATEEPTATETPTEEPTPTATATEMAYLGGRAGLAAPLMEPESAPPIAPLAQPVTTTHRVITWGGRLLPQCIGERVDPTRER